MAELRRLLLEPEQTQINNILERLNNPRVRARELSRTLPDAIRLRNAQDESLKDALGPTVVSAFHASVKKDPHPIAAAISPLMGPAIRRYIGVAISGLLQSFDQTLKYSLSWQGVKWRWEALTTGKRFGEVVLYHTLLYRVEQVFLIHKQTGLLLQHVAAPTAETQDADIVSGMMTAMKEAIGNFGRDSFGLQQGETIDTLDLGSEEVWFEAGPKAILAALIHGQAPQTLRQDLLAPTLEAIHIEQREALEQFDGDNSSFVATRPHLEACLQSRYQGLKDPAQFKVPVYVWLGLFVLLAALGTWAFFAWRDDSRWQAYLQRLQSEPGLVITETDKQNGKRVVAGLRDPLAADPNEILRRETQLDPNAVTGQWQPYQALEPKFILTRAQTLLDPPPGVTLSLENGALSARGTALTQWIAEARRFARALPGVTSFDDQQLINQDLQQNINLIEQTILRFNSGTTQLTGGQTQTVQSLLATMQQLIAQASAVQRVPHFELIGHTDTEGDESLNLKLSQERADRLLTMLSSKGISASLLAATGAGSQAPVRKESSSADKPFNRSVSFKITLRSLSQAGKERQ